MVDHQINRHKWIDFLSVTLELLHTITHRSQIHHGRNAGEILHQHARWAEAHFLVFLALVGKPRYKTLNVGFGDRAIIFIAEKIFEQHFHRSWQSRNALETILLRRCQAEVGISLGTDFEGFAGFEAIK